MTHIGYKKLAHGYMCRLEIIGDHNESRKSVKDIQYASHRCSKARVLKIFMIKDDMSEDYTFDKNQEHGVSIYDPSFIYKVDEIVEVPDFDMDINVVNGKGIHYYRSPIPAYFYKLDVPIGRVIKGWHDNGYPSYEHEYGSEGTLHGICKGWYGHSKQLWYDCVYKSGKKIRGKEYTCDGYLSKNY